MLNRLTIATAPLAIFFATTTGVYAAEAGGVFVLHPNADGAMSLSGTARVVAPVIEVNSSSDRAVNGSGTAIIESVTLHVVGDVDFSSGLTFEGTLTTGSPAESDPHASLAPPSWDPADDLGTVSLSGGAYTISPGYYSGGISLSGGTALTLEPGIYILGGRGLDMSSSCHIEGFGVMLFITGTGCLEMTGSSSANLRPSSIGEYAAISVFQDRSTSSEVKLAGSSGLQIHGAVYAPSASVTITGTADAEGIGPLVGSLLVANQLSLSGDAMLAVGTVVVPSPDGGSYD